MDKWIKAKWKFDCHQPDWWIRELIRNDKPKDIFKFHSFSQQKKVLTEIKGKKEDKFSGQSVGWNTPSCGNSLEYLQKNWLKLFLT